MAYKPEEIETIFEFILSGMRKGLSVNSILKGNDNMPCRDTFDKWLDDDSVKIDKYERAMKSREEVLFDEILQIADNPIEGTTQKIDKDGNIEETKGDMLGHRRLQTDVRKWALSRMNPKKYGDKMINENHNKNENINIEMTKEEFKSLSDELDSEF